MHCRKNPNATVTEKQQGTLLSPGSDQQIAGAAVGATSNSLDPRNCPIWIRHPAHAPSLGIDRSGRAWRISGCLPRSAKCPALYGLIKAGIAHTSGRPSKGAEQNCTSCFEVQRSVNSTPCVLLFIMCQYGGLAFKRTRLRRTPAGWLRLCPEFLTGIFFGLFPFFTYYSLSYEE
jgi:hypothetical protein